MNTTSDNGNDSGRVVEQLMDHSQPSRRDILETPKGRRYIVTTRYRGAGGEVRVKLRAEDNVRLYPSLQAVHEWVNEHGWVVYRQ